MPLRNVNKIEELKKESFDRIITLSQQTSKNPSIGDLRILTTNKHVFCFLQVVVAQR